MYRSPNVLVVRVIKYRGLRWAGRVARMEGGMSAFQILTGKPIGKRPLGRPRLRVDIKEIGISTRNGVDFAQDMDYWRALVNATLNLRVSYAM